MAITIINAGLGLVVAIAIYLLGLPFAIVWSITAFTLNYLPFLGGLIGTAGVAAFSIVSFDSLSYAHVAPFAYQALTSIEAQCVTRFLLGKRLELNTVAVFLTIALWGWIWGTPGAQMSVASLVLVSQSLFW